MHRGVEHANLRSARHGTLNAVRAHEVHSVKVKTASAINGGGNCRSSGGDDVSGKPFGKSTERKSPHRECECARGSDR